MSTLRQHLGVILNEAETSFDHCPALAEIEKRATAALKELDDSETAWREAGGTYRLVPDEIEVPS